jgi:hypothetical protein
VDVVEELVAAGVSGSTAKLNRHRLASIRPHGVGSTVVRSGCGCRCGVRCPLG